MLRLALIAGTYQPERCGVAHYTACLRTALAELGVESQVLTTVLTTYAAAQSVGNPNVIGVIRDWRLPELWTLVKAVRASRADLLHIQHAAGTYGRDVDGLAAAELLAEPIERLQLAAAGRESTHRFRWPVIKQSHPEPYAAMRKQ